MKWGEVNILDLISVTIAVLAFLIVIFKDIVIPWAIKFFRTISIEVSSVATIGFSGYGNTINIPIQFITERGPIQIKNASLEIDFEDKKVKFFWRYTAPPKINPVSNSADWMSYNLPMWFERDSDTTLSLIFSDWETNDSINGLAMSALSKMFPDPYQQEVFRLLDQNTKFQTIQKFYNADKDSREKIHKGIYSLMKWKKGKFRATLNIEFSHNISRTHNFEIDITPSIMLMLLNNIPSLSFQLFGVASPPVFSEVRLPSTKS